MQFDDVLMGVASLPRTATACSVMWESPPGDEFATGRSLLLWEIRDREVGSYIGLNLS
jgi:hypothetical protein